MSSRESEFAATRCATCGALLRAYAGRTALCPACVIGSVRFPAEPDRNSADRPPDALSGGATWPDAFPQLELLSELRRSRDAAAYLMRDCRRGDSEVILQVVEGRLLSAAGGAEAMMEFVTQVREAHIPGIASVVEAGDLVGAFYVLTALPRTAGNLLAARVTYGTHCSEVLDRAAEAADRVVEAARKAGLTFRFDPLTAWIHEQDGPGGGADVEVTVTLTPDLRYVANSLADGRSEASTPVCSRVEAAVPLQAGDLLGGDFYLEEPVGEGGFGQVWRARQERPVRRTVALKVLKHGAVSPRTRARFEIEQQALARLDHPNVARYFDGGIAPDGRPFFAMEWIDGRAITRFCREEGLSLKERLRLFGEVCEAVQHAHQKGILHRDLKSANVLVTNGGGVPGGSVPKVIDFGIARALEESLIDMTLLTRTLEFVGTPASMSPEQAAGAGGVELDVRTDVYGLGVLLYELLTGTLPFAPDLPPDELRRRIRENDPVRPSVRVNNGETSRRLRRDLDWIVMKCLEKDPERRYASVSALARDLQRHLADEPVEARPPGHGYRFRKFARRNKPLLAAMTTVGLVLLAASIVSTWLAVRATDAEMLAQNRLGEVERERNDKEEARKEAERQRNEALWNQYVARQFPIVDAWENEEYGHLEKLLEEQIPEPGQPDFRGWEWAYFEDQCDQVFRTIEGRCGIWHPAEDAITAVTVGEGQTSSIDLRSPKDGSLLRIIAEVPTKVGEEIKVLRWASEGKRIAYLTNRSRLAVLDAHAGETIFHEQIPLPDWTTDLFNLGVATFDISSDGKTVATGHFSSGLIQLWDVESGERSRVLYDPKEISHLESIEFSPDGTQLAAALRFGRRATWDIRTGESFDYERVCHKNGSVAWSRCGTRFAATGGDALTVYELQHSKPIAQFTHRSVNAIAWIGDRTLVSSGNDHRVRLWDADSFEKVAEFQVSEDVMRNVAVHRDGSHLVLSSGDSTRIMSLSDRPLRSLVLEPRSKHEKNLFDLSSSKYLEWDREGSYIVSAGTTTTPIIGRYAASITAWDARSGRLLRRAPVGLVRSLKWSSDRAAALLSTHTGLLHEIGLFPAEHQNSRVFPNKAIGNFSTFSPNEKWLALALSDPLASSDPEVVQLFDVESRQMIHMVDGHNVVNRWSHDNRLIAAGDWGTVLVWDPFSGHVIGKRKVTEGLQSLAWNPDNSLLALGRLDGRIAIVRADTLEELAVLDGHSGDVASVDWADNGRIASASPDGTVRIWDDGNGDELLAFAHPHPDSFQTVRWSPDGRRLAAGDNKGRVFVWGSGSIASLPDRTKQLATGAIANQDPEAPQPLGADKRSHLARVVLEKARQRISADAHSDIEKAASQLLLLADAYAAVELFAESLEITDDSVRTLMGRLGPEHADTLDARLKLAGRQAASGFHDQAVSTARKVVEIHRRILAPDHPNRLMGELYLASLCLAAEKASEAMEILNQLFTPVNSPELSSWNSALSLNEGLSKTLAEPYRSAKQREVFIDERTAVVDILKTVVDGEKADVWKIVSDIAFALLDAESKVPVVVLEDLSAKLQRVYGADHATTLAAEMCLANVFVALDLPGRAAEIVEQIRAKSVSRFGGEHSQTIVSTTLLADLYRRIGRANDSLDHFEASLSVYDRALGNAHPDTMRLLSRFALGAFEAGDLDRAAARCRQLLQRLEVSVDRVEAPEHVLTVVGGGSDADELRFPARGTVNAEEIEEDVLAGHVIELAGHLREQQEIDLATRMSMAALRHVRRRLGPESPMLVTATEDLALSYQARPEGLDNALKLYREFLSWDRVHSNRNNTTEILRKLAAVLRENGRKPETVPLHEERLLLLEQHQRPLHQGTLTCLFDLYVAQFQSGNPENAIPLAKLLAGRYLEAEGPTDPYSLFIAKAEVGYMLIWSGKRSAGIALLEEAVEELRTFPVVDTTWHYATAQCSLGYGYLWENRLTDAIVAYEKGLAGLEMGSPSTTEFVTQNHWQRLSQCYQDAGRNEDAITLERKFVEYRRHLFGGEDARTLSAEYSLAKTLVKCGELDEGIRLLEGLLTRLDESSVNPRRRDVLGRLADAYGLVGREAEKAEALAECRHLASHELDRSYEKLGVSFSGDTVIIPPDATWRWYHLAREGKPLDSEFYTAFHRPDYDDRHWKMGKGTLLGGFGYYDAGSETERYNLFFSHPFKGPADADEHHPAFFRHRFTTTEAYQELELILQHDDGIVVFLDGKEVARENVRPGVVGAELYARQCRNYWTDANRILLPGGLEPGEHVLAISLHDHDCWNKDLRLAGVTLLARKELSEKRAIKIARPGSPEARRFTELAWLLAQRAMREGDEPAARDRLLLAAIPDLALNPENFLCTDRAAPAWLSSLIEWECRDRNKRRGWGKALVERESLWRFHIGDGAVAPTPWSIPDFDDSSWPRVRAPLGYGDQAVVSRVVPDERPVDPTTVYFRHGFSLGEAEEQTNLYLFLRADDGAAVYLNGHEVVRARLPDGRIGPDTLATRALNDAQEGDYEAYPLPPDLLREGENLLAVEVHQASPESSDVIFDLELRSLPTSLFDTLRKEFSVFPSEEVLHGFRSANSFKLPELPPDWRSRVDAQLMAHSGNWQEALAAAEAMMAAGPRDSALLRFRWHCFQQLERTVEAANGMRQAIPVRDPDATNRQLDLTDVYNRTLDEPLWLLRDGRRSEPALEELPRGIHSLAEVPFDLRGAIWVAGRGIPDSENAVLPSPEVVSGIAFGEKAERLHFLHASSRSTSRHGEKPGDEVGRYVIRYVDGTMETVPIRYRLDIDFDRDGGVLREEAEYTIVWQSPTPNHFHGRLRLYVKTWENPRPDVKIASIDVECAENWPGFYVSGITAE